MDLPFANAYALLHHLTRRRRTLYYEQMANGPRCTIYSYIYIIAKAEF